MSRRSELTRERILQALERAGGNRSKAAELLGVGRATLYRWIDRHGLEAGALKTIGGRWDLLRLLGEGSQATVHLVRDRTGRHGECALKLYLLPPTPGPAEAGRDTAASREFRALSLLRAPGLARVHDTGLDDATGRPFVVMDFIAGRPLDQASVGRPPRWIASVLRRVLETIDHLHRRGIIHRDIKPGNILVEDRGDADEPGSVTVTDLALAEDLAGRMQVAGGTLPYAAPEILSGARASPRSDLYALGVSAYVALTGRFPREALVAPRARSIEAPAPKPPSSLRADVPLELDRIVLALIEDDPAQRPADAAGVIEALDAWLGESGDSPRQEDDELVGREPEIEAVVSLLDDAGSTSRRHGALAVVGDEGGGRTRFLHACLERLRARGWRVALGSCGGGAGGREVLVNLVREALSGADGRGETTEDVVLSRYAKSLPSILPGLIHDESVVPDPAGRTTRVGRPHALDLVASLLVDLSEIRPLVVAIDDLDEADPLVLDLFWLLSRRAARHPLRLLATTRVAPDAGGRIEGFLQGATTEGLLQLMPLGPLDPPAVVRMAENVLGSARAAVFGDRIHDLTGGHARFTSELLHELRERKSIPTGREEIDLPRTARDAVRSRVRRVSRPARRVLDALAVAGGPRSPVRLSRVLPPDSLTELEGLLRRRLVLVKNGESLEIENRSLRDVLVEDLTEEAQCALHAAWAAALEGDDDALVDRAGHLRDAGGGAEIEGELLAAADRLVEAWQYDQAIRFFREALERVDRDEARRLSIYPKLEMACREAHERQAAADACREWAALAHRLGDLAAESKARAYLAGSLRELREWGEALAAARAAVELAERSGEERLISLANKSLAIVLWVSWRKREAIPPLERALELARTARDAKGQAYTLQDVALLQSVIGRPATGLSAAAAAQQLFREAGDDVWPVLARSNEALILAWLGETKAACTLLQTVVAELEKTSSSAPLEVPLENLAMILCRAGRYDEALAAAQRLVDEAARRGRNSHRISGLLCRGEALFQLDDRDAARQHHKLARDLALSLGESRQAMFAGLAVARDLRVASRLDAASELARAIHEEASLDVALRQRSLAAIEAARVELDRGNAAEAQRWLDDAESTTQSPSEDAPAIRAMILLERTRAWRRLGRPVAALAACDEGLALARHRGPADVEIALLVEAAELIEARGDEERAGLSWQAAADRVEEIGSLLEDPVHRARWIARPDLAAIAASAERRRAAGGVGAPSIGRREDLSSLYEVSRAIASGGDLLPLMQRIVELAVQRAGGERGLLLLRDGEGALQPAAAVGIEPGSETDAVRISTSALERAGAGGELLVRDTRESEELSQAASVAMFDIRSILCVPLIVADESRGALYVDATGSRVAFSESDLAFLRALADQAAVAIAYGELLGHLLSERDALRRTAVERHRFSNIVGDSKPMQDVFALLERFADAELPVLIYGESGTGKELVARALHFNSRRRDGPFLSENCAAVPETLLESTLFGYVRGAFTGADRDKPGLFALANGGTLFLDEIGDMSPELQVRLLRVIQEKEFRPVGGEALVKTNVRIVAATHRDLPDAVGKGAFREDLFFRLNGLSVTLPPLRERREDIPLLVSHFLQRRAEETRDARLELAPAVLRALVAHHWPGNVRQLENTIKRLALFADEGRIELAALRGDPDLGRLVRSPASAASSGQAAGEGEPASEPAREIEEALERAGGDKVRAAALLGISRATLYRRMRGLGLTGRR